MAITTMDQIQAGLLPKFHIIKMTGLPKAQGTLFTPFYISGNPPAATAPASGLNGTSLTSYTGQIPVPAPVAGKNIYLAGLEIYGNTNQLGGMTLIDRLWHNSGIAVTTTTAQAITMPTLPARDNLGTTNGLGILAALECSGGSTNAAVSNTTITYTNDVGTSGRTGTLPTTPASITVGTFLPFNLQAGDNGIRSIQAITLGTSYVTGTFHLVLYREMASLGTYYGNQYVKAGPIELGLPRIYDNAVLQQIYSVNASSMSAMDTTITFAQG